MPTSPAALSRACVGISTRPYGSETGLLPVVSESGIEIMSMNLLLPQEETAVIWRAPMLSKAIQQFWTDVVWGKLDYLLIDLPPGLRTRR